MGDLNALLEGAMGLDAKYVKCVSQKEQNHLLPINLNIFKNC